jgi:misacylated tRNA(Ala) deacylase
LSDVPVSPPFPATELLFREDAYRQSTEVRVLGLFSDFLVLDATLLYPASGGQPADAGRLVHPSGHTVPVLELRYLDAAKTIVGHKLPDGEDPKCWLETTFAMTLDFDRRLRLMRMHSALHLLSVALPYAVTGGAIGTEEGRLDFDIPDAGLDKEAITAELNRLIGQDADITTRWITDAELDANPQLVKTMSVKPPRGSGRVRLVEIAGLDLQPCGGTHVRNTREIGSMIVTNIEKKGKQNRRVRVAFADKP